MYPGAGGASTRTPLHCEMNQDTELHCSVGDQTDMVLFGVYMHVTSEVFPPFDAAIFYMREIDE